VARVLQAREKLADLALEESRDEAAAALRSVSVALAKRALQPIQQQCGELRRVLLLHGINAGDSHKLPGVHRGALTGGKQCEDPLEGLNHLTSGGRLQKVIPEVNVEEQVLQQAIQIASSAEVPQTCWRHCPARGG